jgi:hypothetical protein
MLNFQILFGPVLLISGLKIDATETPLRFGLIVPIAEKPRIQRTLLK